MTILPLVVRELRTAVRRPYAYRIRLGIATGAMVVAVWGLWAWSSWLAGAFVGHSLFRVLAGLAFAAILSTGLVLTADSISQERREGTLGLLFLTDLTAADVVLGKLAGKAVLPFYMLLGLLPALAVFTLVGGVTGGEVWRMMLALGNTLFVSLSMALFTSVFCTEQRMAHASAALVLAFLAGGVAAMETMAPSLNGTSLSVAVETMSLTTPFSLAGEREFRAAPSMYFGSLLVTHLMAWSSLVVACQRTPRACRERPRSDKAQTAIVLVHNSEQGKISPGRITGDPVRWLASRHKSRPNVVWTIPWLALAGLASLSLVRGGTNAGNILGCVVAAQMVFRLWIALDASHTFNSSRRTGTLESLLGTPLTGYQIGRGMVSAFHGRFLGPGALISVLGLGSALYLSAYGDDAPALALLVVSVTLLVDISCLTWVGLWRGLASSGSTTAILSTLGRTIILPIGAVGILKGIFPASSWATFALLYFILTLVNNLLFRASARARLCKHFRTMALRPYGGKVPHIESKWSPINWEAEGALTELIQIKS